MERTLITPASLTRNDGVTPTPVTIDGTLVSNGAYINCLNQDAGALVLRVTNTHGSAHVITFNYGEFQIGPQSDVAVSVDATTGVEWFMFESARVLDADGYITIDFDTGHTGTIEAVWLPK